MKVFYSFFFLLLLPVSGFSQDVFSKLADDVCACMRKQKAFDKSTESMQLALGFCLLENVGTHKAALKKVGYETERTGDFEKISEKTGAYLAFQCPEVLSMVSKMLEDEDSDFREKVMERVEERKSTGSSSLRSDSYKGAVAGVKQDDLFRLLLRSNTGGTVEFIWLEKFYGDDLLMGEASIKKLLNRNVEVQYVEKEIYNPKTASYQTVKCITGLSLN